MNKMSFEIPKIAQNDLKCASASLKQILEFYNYDITIEEIENNVIPHFSHRDWIYKLGIFALNKNFNVNVHTRSLLIFDSTWFKLDTSCLINKLVEKIEFIKTLETKPIIKNKMLNETTSILNFLELGGKINFTYFSIEMIDNYIAKQIPLMVMVTLQLIFEIKKEYNKIDDDIRGYPWQHSLILNGYDETSYFVTDNTYLQNEIEYKISKKLLLDSIIRTDSLILVVTI